MKLVGWVQAEETSSQTLKDSRCGSQAQARWDGRGRNEDVPCACVCHERSRRRVRPAGKISVRGGISEQLPNRNVLCWRLS